MAKVEQQKNYLALLEKSICDNNLKNCVINVSDNSKCHGGYNGDMVLVNVLGKNGKNYNLLVKKASRDESIRRNIPIRQLYVTETFIYAVVFNIFKEFQEKHATGTSYPSVPAWFGSNLDDSDELLILENLRPKGYEMHDVLKTMNLQHLKLVLGEYARLHALSFALKDQRPGDFGKFPKNKFKSATELMVSGSVVAKLNRCFYNISKVLRVSGRLDLLEKFESLGENIAVKIKHLFYADEPQSVLVHGDCWNNNFLFKYEDNNRDNPVAVCLIDFQLANILSPVFDLSFFLFTTCSKAEYQHFDELLQWYYSSFASFLTTLGSDPGKLFSFDDLLVHWKKYSIMGFMIAPLSLKFIFNENEALTMEELTSNEDGFLIKSNLHAYNERLIEVTEQYFKSLGQ